MASQTSTERPSGSEQYDQFVRSQVGKTQQQLKSVELMSEVLTLVAGMLGYLLLLILLDHWILPGGLGTWGRVLGLLGLLGGGLFVLWWRVLPLVVRKINPLYAAANIERSEPTLKNGLINFLLLKSQPAATPPVVMQELEHRAAADLSRVSIDSAVDRSRLIKIGYVLTALVAVACLYKVLSPKDPLQSVGRVVFPWTEMAAPSRVTIVEVSPGDSEQYMGENVEITARVEGLSANENVLLHWSSTDGTHVDQETAMTLPVDALAYRAELPGTPVGLGQDLEYYITAGDARTPIYSLQVRPAPSITVDAVSYNYPDYTGLKDRQDNVGDIIAPQGTQVTVFATANQPIQERSARVMFNGDDRIKPLRLRTSDRDPQQVSGTFTLLMTDEGKPEYESYQIRFRNNDGYENPSPIRYKIRVIADVPPEIRFVSPAKHLQVPVNGRAELKLEASDDYGLARVELHAHVANQEALKPQDAVRLDELRRDLFTDSFVVQPSHLGASVGDTILYWAEATDNKQPRPNTQKSTVWQIEVTEPMKGDGRGQPDQLAQNDQGQPPQKPETPEAGQRGKQPKPPEQSQPGNEGQKPPMPQDQAGQGEQGSQPSNEKQTEGDLVDKLRDILNPDDEQQGQEKQGDQDPQQGQNEPQKGQQQGEDGQQGQQNNAGGENNKEQKGQGQPMGSQGNQEGQGQKQQGQGGSKQEPSGGEGGGSDSKSGQSDSGSQKGAGQQGAKSGQPGGNASQPGSQKQPGSGQPSDSKQPGAGSDSGEPLKGTKPDDPNAKGKPTDRKIEGEGTDTGKAGDPANAQSRDGQPSGKGQTSSGGQKPTGKPQPEQGAGSENKGGKPNASGMGDASKPNQTTDSEGTKGGEKDDSQGGDPSGTKGNPGEGTGQKDSEGTVSEADQGLNKDRNKKPGDNQNETDDDQGKASSSSISNEESDSKRGKEKGDRSGAGGEGGGQQANNQGTGGPGSNTASQQGASEAPGPGQGKTGNRGGDDAISEKPTGKSGDQAGQGSKTVAKPDGSERGEGDQQQTQGQQPKGNPQSGQPGQGDPQRSGTSDPNGNGRGTPAPGAGNRRQQSTGDPRDGSTSSGADDPNLEYSRKTLDLVLEKLEDQLDKNQPDQDLLDLFGGDQEKMRSWMQKWKQRMDAARQPGAQGAEARRELDKRLRSLGLTRPGGGLEGSAGGESLGNNRQGINLPPPPARYRHQAEAYKESVQNYGKK